MYTVKLEKGKIIIITTIVKRVGGGGSGSTHILRKSNAAHLSLHHSWPTTWWENHQGFLPVWFSVGYYYYFIWLKSRCKLRMWVLCSFITDFVLNIWIFVNTIDCVCIFLCTFHFFFGFFDVSGKLVKWVLYIYYWGFLDTSLYLLKFLGLANERDSENKKY